MDDHQTQPKRDAAINVASAPKEGSLGEAPYEKKASANYEVEKLQTHADDEEKDRRDSLSRYSAGIEPEVWAKGGQKGCSELCSLVIKVIQYIFGITMGLYSCFITFYGLVNGYNGTSDYLHPAVSIVFLALLLTILGFSEGTQIALMLLEKIPTRDLPTSICCAARVRKTHIIAQNNTERYLVGRQIFVTGIVFLIAKLIYMKPEYALFVEETLGFLGHPMLINIFVYTGLSGSLVVLAFGQLLPQLLVTTSPIMQYQLFPTYEIIVIQLFCERLGVAYMANMVRDFTRWAFNLVDEPFGVGSGVEISAAGSSKQDDEEEELTCFVKFWMTVPRWTRIVQYVMGFIVFCGGIALILLNVLGGHSDFTRIEWETSDTDGFCKNDTGMHTADSGLNACAAAGNVWVGAKLAPIVDKSGNWVTQSGDIPVWVQLLVFIPLSNIAMGFLEGSQIAILALEKAPARTVKSVHRPAYFGHKLSQQGDNVRRYLLGRQFLVVFVDFIAAHTMGLGGLGILVPISQLYPQLLAASNPMWFLGTWGSRCVLLLALLMEFLGFCHFSWALFLIVHSIRNVINGDSEKGEEVGSVGQNVDIAGQGVGTTHDDRTYDQLCEIVIQQKLRINELEARIGVVKTIGDDKKTTSDEHASEI